MTAANKDAPAGTDIPTSACHGRSNQTVNSYIVSPPAD